MPLIVIVFVAHTAVIPPGNPVGVPIPVAIVVVCIILGLSKVLIHRIGEDEAADTVLSVTTMIVPVAFTLPQPPVKGML